MSLKIVSGIFTVFDLLLSLRSVGYACRKQAVLLAIFAASCITAEAQSTESVRQRSIEYVLSHPKTCVVTNGYRCQEVDEASQQLNQQLSVPGRYLLAWPMVQADFKSLQDLSRAQKDLHHYTVSFAGTENRIIVILTALLLPAMDAQGVPNGELLRSTLGKSMRYELDRQSLNIVSRKYYK